MSSSLGLVDFSVWLADFINFIACLMASNCPGEGGGGGALPSNRPMGCATGWDRTFTTGLTKIGLPFQAFSIELLEWGCTFSGL